MSACLLDDLSDDEIVERIVAGCHETCPKRLERVRRDVELLVRNRDTEDGDEMLHTLLRMP